MRTETSVLKQLAVVHLLLYDVNDLSAEIDIETILSRKNSGLVNRSTIPGLDIAPVLVDQLTPLIEQNTSELSCGLSGHSHETPENDPSNGFLASGCINRSFVEIESLVFGKPVDLPVFFAQNRCHILFRNQSQFSPDFFQVIIAFRSDLY